MGQASFVVSGLGNPESYESCSHGAGRVMSRTQARKRLTAESLAGRMSGVAWQEADAVALLDEHPESYKDVETVMRDQADLVRIDYRLRAIANYKGVEAVRRKR
jgi:tRNA-splicing ligase RtcB